MLKRLTALALAALLALMPAALAEVYEGVTAALSTVTVLSAASGAVAELDARIGDWVEAGQALATLSAEPTFATQDGTVSLINAREGEDVSGDCLELLPVNLYEIYCTVDKAYQSADSTLVHSGETLYVKCTADGSHRAVGVVTAIDGEEYRVVTLGGELYVGETVYLYRDEDFTTAQRVGIGTVLSSDPEVYRAEGTVTRMCVAEGDFVERGQLLFTLNGGGIDAPADGILTALSLSPGDSVAEDQAVAEIVPADQICVELRVDEDAAARIRPGDEAELYFADRPEISVPGTVDSVAWIAADGEYAVRVLPGTDAALSLGMSVSARL
ncbi:MAG: HlyD family efflux transporter periplasmic adaptor subunit [Clostridia bacterium]|nr:HlyD family efflux transporter periplasmic adaptor subunit [Clostridia bacterium]